MSCIAASSVGGASRVTQPILWGCGQGFTIIRPCAARFEYSVACVINPLPIPVNLRGAAMYCVPCPYKVSMGCEFIGGEMMFPFAIFLTRCIGVATEGVAPRPLCNQRVPCWQGLPRTPEKGSGARAIVAPVVAPNGVSVQFGLGFGRTHRRADGLLVGRFLFGQGIGQEFLDPCCGRHLAAVIPAGRVGRINRSPFSRRGAQGAFSIAIRYNRSGCHLLSPSFLSLSVVVDGAT